MINDILVFDKYYYTITELQTIVAKRKRKMEKDGMLNMAWWM